MELANVYGINMGNILSTASNIKTARLSREAKQRKLDKDKARERNAMAKIKKGQEGYDTEADETVVEESKNALLTDKVKELTEEVGVGSDEETKQAEAPLTDEPKETVNAISANKNVFGQDMEMPQLSKQEMKDYALDNVSYDKLVAKVETAKLVQRQYEQKLATLQMTMPDATPAQRQQLAKASVADMKTFTDMIVKADDKTRKIAKEEINVQARQVFRITQLPKEGAARKDAYTQWRNSQIQAVPKDKQQQVINSIPEWQDGKTMNWIGMKLAEAKDTFDTINDIEAETTKHLRSSSKIITHSDKDIKLTPTKKGWKEDTKTSNALLKEQEKSKGSAKTSDYSLINKATWQNFTGLDIDNPDDKKLMSSKYNQSERDLVTKFASDAAMMFQSGKARNPLEAVQMVKDKMSKDELAKLEKIEAKKKKFKETNTDTRFR